MIKQKIRDSHPVFRHAVPQRPTERSPPVAVPPIYGIEALEPLPKILIRRLLGAVKRKLNRHRNNTLPGDTQHRRIIIRHLGTDYETGPQSENTRPSSIHSLTSDIPFCHEYCQTIGSPRSAELQLIFDSLPRSIPILLDLSCQVRRSLVRVREEVCTCIVGVYVRNPLGRRDTPNLTRDHG